LLLSDYADTANITNGPIVVHCSAGVGRTGTFCAIHSTLELMRMEYNFNNSIDPTLTVANTVIGLRECRTNMVQTSVTKPSSSMINLKINSLSLGSIGILLQSNSRWMETNP
jgi:hypothetical protein